MRTPRDPRNGRDNARAELDRDATDHELELMRDMADAIRDLQGDLRAAHAKAEREADRAGKLDRALARIADAYNEAKDRGLITERIEYHLGGAIIDALKALWINHRHDPPTMLPNSTGTVTEAELTIPARIAALEASLDILSTDHHDRITELERRADHLERVTHVHDTDQRPHSRACGFAGHPHGAACSTNCPTCHGQDPPPSPPPPSPPTERTIEIG